MRPMHTALVAAASAAALALPLAAYAQAAYPTKPIQLVLPLGAGSASDVAVRMLTERGAPVLKQQVVVLQEPGAGGTIGAARAAKSPPGGYTLTALDDGITTVAPHIYAKVGYDPSKSF